MSSLFSALKIPQLSNFCQAKRSRGTFVSFWFGRMESRNFCIEFLVRGRDPPHSLPQREVPSRQPPRVTNKHTTYTTHTYTYMNIKEMEEKKWLLFSLFLVCFLFLFCPLCVGGEEEQNINFEKNWEVEWGWEGGMKKGGWRERRQDVMCYPLLLDNECGEVLDGTNVPPPAQEARFNLFAQVSKGREDGREGEEGGGLIFFDCFFFFFFFFFSVDLRCENGSCRMSKTFGLVYLYSWDGFI